MRLGRRKHVKVFTAPADAPGLWSEPMVSPLPRPARARSAAEKTQRRDDILRAAERLWTSTSYTDLSMNHVAREAKLAKGTLYLYFDTKEELFLALVTEHLHTWVSSTVRLLQERQPRSAQAVADVLLDASVDVAPLRRLLVLLGTVLERNVRPELTREFRKELRARIGLLVAHLPFSEATGLRILRHLYALGLGWQQLSEEQALSSAPSEAPGDQGGAADPFSQEFELAMRAVIDRLAAEETRGSQA